MISRLGTATRRIRDRLRPRAAILMYHRVAEPETDPWEMCVTPARFAQQMEVIRATRPCVPLAALAGRGAASFPHGTIAITFDDGYADNLHEALPILEHNGLPATFFVIAQAAGAAHELWWDTLERFLLRPGSLPETLVLALRGQRREWTLGPEATYGAAEFEARRGWRVGEPPPGPRQAVCAALWQWLMELPATERNEVIAQIAASAEQPGRPHQDYRTLSVNELRRLAASANIEIGAHTASHPVLPRLAPADARHEIEYGRNRLREWLDREPSSFSFPFGFHDTATVALVRAVGFDRACTTEPRPYPQAADPLTMPRFHVENMDGDAFAEWLWWVLPQ